MYSLLYGSIEFYHYKFSRSNNNALCSYSWFLCDNSRSFFQWFSRLLEIINEFRKLPNHFCLYFKRTFLMEKKICKPWIWSWTCCKLLQDYLLPLVVNTSLMLEYRSSNFGNPLVVISKCDWVDPALLWTLHEQVTYLFYSTHACWYCHKNISKPIVGAQKYFSPKLNAKHALMHHFFNLQP